jgi:phosphatidylserine synthase
VDIVHIVILPSAVVAEVPVQRMKLANALTYVSLAAAMLAVAAAMHGSAAGTGACLALAALADTFDGWYARRFTRDAHAEALGAQLDSLSDGVAFGAVPVVAMSVLLPAPTGVTSAAWWGAAILYVACTVTRLAIYNVNNLGSSGVRGLGSSGRGVGSSACHAEALRNDTRQGREVFIGIPTPVAAMIWSTVFLLPVDVHVAIPIALATGVAMVSPVRIARPHGLALLTFALWPIGLVIAHSLRA